MARSRTLTVIAILLAADILLRVADRVTSSLRLSTVQAQAAAQPVEKVAIATAQGPGNQPWCFVYNVESERLTAYEAGREGLELQGARHLTYDFKIVELRGQAAMSKLTVQQVKDLVK